MHVRGFFFLTHFCYTLNTMAVDTDPKKIKELLERGTADIIELMHLRSMLSSGKQLRVKFGIDPTRPNIHLGHSVLLRKLRAFQILGHKIILIIGDFTAQIGDPSGRDEARVPLTHAQVEENMEGYLSQVKKIVHIDKEDIKYNSEWFKNENIGKIAELARAGSIQQILKRADFKKRLDEGNDISFLEALYPLFQGYDSYMVKADIEIGGTDQLFNLLMGRRVQRSFMENEQDIITMELLEGTDGSKKMSKSADNYIGISELAQEMFGKIMSIPDTLIFKYFRLCTDVPEDHILGLEKEMREGKNPKHIKEELALEITSLYHEPEPSKAAKEDFERKFSKGGVIGASKDISFAGGSLKAALMVTGATGSAVARLVEGGSVFINGKKITDWNKAVKPGDIIQYGKKKETIKLVS